MSENSLLTTAVTESFVKTVPTASSSQESNSAKYEEAAQIFDLISQLNSTLNAGANQPVVDSSSSPSSSTSSVGSTLGISKPSEQQSLLKMVDSRQLTTQAKQQTSTASTKIPRINFLHNKPQPQPTPTPILQQQPAPVVATSSSHSITQNMSSSASNSSMGSIPAQQSQPVSPDSTNSAVNTMTMIPKPVFTNIATSTTTTPNNTSIMTMMNSSSRVPRSIVRNSALSAAAVANTNTNTPASMNTSRVINTTTDMSLSSALPLSTNGSMTNSKVYDLTYFKIMASNYRIYPIRSLLTLKYKYQKPHVLIAVHYLPFSLSYFCFIILKNCILDSYLNI